VPRPTKLTISRSIIVVFYASIALLLAGSPLLAQTSSPQDQDRAIDLHTYEAELQRYSNLIEQSKSKPAEIAQLRNSLPAGWTVEANGAEFHVSAGPIASALIDMQARPNQAEQVARSIEFRLEEMRQSAIELANESGDASLSTARADLKETFDRREFRGMKGPTALQLMEERIANWIGRLILRLLSRLHISARTGNFVAWMILALAFGGICYWIYRTLSRRTTSDELPSSSPVAASDSREWVNDALAAAERGDFREAVHCAYWASIARLEDLRLLKRDRSRTPREFLRLLDRHASERSSLQNLTARFELIWYGDRPASQADWSEAKILLEKFGCLAASTAPIANS
jgi:hypothetical protein